MNLDIRGFDFIKVPIKYGFGSAFLYSILINILHILSPTDIETGKWASYFSIVFLWIGIFLGLMERDKVYFEGRMNYINGLATSLFVTIISSVLMGAFMYIYVEYINPELVDIVADKAKTDMLKNGISNAEITHTLKPIYYHYKTRTQVINQLQIGLMSGVLFSFIAPLLKFKKRSKKYNSTNVF